MFQIERFIAEQRQAILDAGGYVHPNLYFQIKGDQITAEGDIKPEIVSLIVPKRLSEWPNNTSKHKFVSDHFNYDWSYYKRTRNIYDKLWPLAMYFDHSDLAKPLQETSRELIFYGIRLFYTNNRDVLRRIYGV